MAQAEDVQELAESEDKKLKRCFLNMVSENEGFLPTQSEQAF